MITACLWALAGTAVAVESDVRSATTVEGVTVVADLDVRMVVAVGGDVDASTYVASAPPGLACGGAQYQYMTKENRQCWLRIKRKAPIVLTAQANGHYGSDWTVQWVGCEPIANGAACTLSARDEVQVVALFTRR
ncbi:MAG: hypothetical protein Q7U20_08620 [Caulobacter sp.]|nr:hypothetical protein [Caulobacter sp.]